MTDEKRLEQEYRELKCRQAPDLWERIEGNLQKHPERNPQAGTNAPEVIIGAGRRPGRFKRNQVYGMATVAAAVLVLLVAAPEFLKGRGGKDAMPNQTAPLMAGAAEAAPEMEGEAGAETEAAVPESAAIPQERAAAEKNVLSSTRDHLPDGVLAYDQLQLASYQPVALPKNAVSVAEDSQYFSEEILKDAELLCGGTVTGVSLEQDASGKAVKVVYEMALEQVYYAEDYTTGMETVTVKSPIVKADGDEMYILYQLQPGGTYLLPLHKPDQDWELLYPFAPQIQVSGDGAYLFHSGYTSLMNEDTSVVVGRPEGDNDYFYDRMVLRRDEDFLSDLLKLVED